MSREFDLQMFATDISEAWVKEFADNLRHVLQQKSSLFRDKVTVETLVAGEEAAFDYLEDSEAVERVARHQATAIQELEFSKRWCVPKTCDWHTLLDKRDVKRMLTDPSSRMLENAVMALNRKMDKIIVAAFYASAKTGKAGDGTANFDSSNMVVAVDVVDSGTAAATGMNMTKIRTAEKLMETYYSEEGDLFLAMAPLQKSQVLGNTQAISADYVQRGAVETGKLPKLYGFTPVIYNGLPTDASSYRECYFWNRSCMGVKILEDINIEINVRSDLSNARQLSVSMDVGAVRLQEKGVGRILCSES